MPDVVADVWSQLRQCKIFLICHTHWDREWYSTANVYLHRSVEFMQRVMEVHGGDSAFPPFYMDGQTCLLDDYLRICPHQRGRLKKMITDGRMQIGPWYVQPEEHQPSGESHIRNLELGMQIARDFGDNAPKVGYLCDPITYIPQMPQLLRLFGIQSMLHGRGITKDHARSPQEMRAVAPDGSSVFLFHLTYPYYMDFGTTYEQFAAKLQEVAKNGLLKGTRTGLILLTSGGDQLYPTGQELSFIARLKEEQNITITPTTLPEYIQLLQDAVGEKPLPQVNTEGVWERLQDIYTARIPLKRRIKRAERRLERTAEPLVTLASLCGADPQTDMLRELWRRNSENMFHDSIYCAHADEVTTDIEHRCTQLDELVDRIENIAFYEVQRLAPDHFKSPATHALLNTLGISQKGFHEVEFYTDQPGPQKIADLSGREIPALLLSERSQTSLLTERYCVDSQVYAPPIKVWQRYLLALPELPPTSPLLLTLAPREEESTTDCSSVLRMENQRLFISTGSREVPLEFILEVDAGDQYTFAPEGPAEMLTCHDAQWIRKNGFTILTVSLRSAVRKVSCQVTFWQHADTPEVRARFVFDNQDQNFRIALRIPKLLPTGRHTAHTPYAAVERQIQKMADAGWCGQDYQVRFPFVEFCGMNTADEGLNLFSPDISNYHMAEDHTLTLALFRSVSDLTIPRFLAGPPMPTPLAQIRGRSEFDLTLIPRPMSPVEQMRQAWRHNSPLAYFPLQIAERSGVVRPETKPSDHAKKLSFPYLQCDDNNLLIAAFRPHPERPGTFLVRVVNLSEHPVSATLRTGFDLHGVWLTDLLHNLRQKIHHDIRTIPLSMKPSEIRTLMIAARSDDAT